ncbi:hypothetical protein [Rufibacter sp. LB8]|uniref:hypothetical protein n=1 Tax=Rufibacter sp. LB8 TaxID=2777781 RepID=UPI00178C5869|nr:hypothetical protein [Rufibacter sp. LB8]
MKAFVTATLAFSFWGTLPAVAQTLSGGEPKNTTAPAPAKKQADPALAAKMNAIIKGQKTPVPKTATEPAVKPPPPPAQIATQPAKPSTAKEETAEKPKPALPASQSKVEKLITEREQLVLKYDYLKTQETNFWGKASKEDMRAVIEALKEVLQKDEQIIHAVEQANLETRRNVAKRAAELEAEAKKLNNQVLGDKRVVTDNIYELKASLANAQNLNRRRDRQLKDLEERLEAANAAKFEHDAITVFFAFLAIGLGWYIVRLKSKLTVLKEQKQKAKV